MKNTRRCKICKERFKPRFSGLQPVCEKPSCLAEWGRLKVRQKIYSDEKDKKARDRHWIKETKEKHKTHSDYENELQSLVNKICRLIDKECGCISCGRPLVSGKGVHAGHYRSVGDNNSIRFNLLNIFKQCYVCNTQKSANIHGYNEGLIKLFGNDFQQKVEWLISEYPIIKLSIPELKECIVTAKQIIKELEKLDLVYPAEMRVRLRNEYNKRIGIYTL